MSQKSNYCWIHIENLKMFLYLGANPHEKKIGQNITMNLSLSIPYNNTKDLLENTIDYGMVTQTIENELKKLEQVNLIEYLCEYILDCIGKNFMEVKAAKVTIQKGYVPLPHFTGTVRIEAEKIYF